LKTMNQKMRSRIRDVIERVSAGDHDIELGRISRALYDLELMYCRSTNSLSRMKLAGAIETIISLLPGEGC